MYVLGSRTSQGGLLGPSLCPSRPPPAGRYPPFLRRSFSSWEREPGSLIIDESVGHPLLRRGRSRAVISVVTLG